MSSELNNNNSNDYGTSIDHEPLHEVQQEQSGWFQTTIRDYSNTGRQFIGANVLTNSWTMMVLGLVVGPIATFFVAFLEYRAIVSLLRVKNHFPDRKRLVSFGQVSNRTIGPVGSWVVEVIVFMCQWLGCVGYAAFAGQNFHKIAGLKYFICVMICVSVSLLMSMLQTPHFLAKLSVVTNLLMFTGVVIIFTQLRFGKEEADRNGEIDLWTDPLHSMIGLSSLATTLGGITTSLDVERTMAHRPGRYHTVLLRTMIFAVSALTFIGMLGYAAFRKNTCSVLTLSLEDGPAKHAAEVILIVGPTLEAVLNSFQMFVGITHRFKEFPSLFESKETRLQFVMLRVIAFVTIAGFAIAVPFFGLIVSLNGAFGYGSLAFLVPPFMELKIIWDMEKQQQQEARVDESNQVNQDENKEESTMARISEEEQRLVDDRQDDSFEVRVEDKVSPSRKVELYAILIFGGIIICFGGFASIRDIVRKEEGLESQGC